jgi:excinuclease UvrABC nuclease subunit
MAAVIAVTKDNHHKPKALLGDENIIKRYKKEILLANHEAHRFAIAFHRKKRSVTP